MLVSSACARSASRARWRAAGGFAYVLEDSLGGALEETLVGPYRSVSAGWFHVCAVRESGAMECWAAEARKELESVVEYPPHIYYGLAEAPAGAYRSVSAAEWHTCAIRDSGEIACWGGPYSELTDAPPGTYRSVSAGSTFTCAVRESGEIECWGLVDAQSGAPSGTYRSVSVSDNDACAIRETGEIDCWRPNWDQVETHPGSYRAVSVGFSYTCAIRESGEIVCWRFGGVPPEIR